MPLPLLDSVKRNWQLLLIASIPGSLLRIAAFLNDDQLADWRNSSGGQDGTSVLDGLVIWAAANPVMVLVGFPLLTLSAILVYTAYHDVSFGITPVLERHGKKAAVAPVHVQRLSADARELLCCVSSTGEFRLESRRTGYAVFVPGGYGGPQDGGWGFYDDTNPEVAHRYRRALAELEQLGLLEAQQGPRLLTAQGWTAARMVTQQALDRIERAARLLAEPERCLLNLIARCQHGHKTDRVVIKRDGTKMSAVYGNGQTVTVPDLVPRAEVFGCAAGDASKAEEFERLVEAMPADYLQFLPEQRLGTPFVVRVTDAGFRYLHHTEILRTRSAA